MGFRRGWLLGLLAGIVAAVISGRPSQPSRPSNDEASGGRPAAGASGSLLDEARAAANTERAATEARMEERFRFARRTGHMPEDPS